VKDKAESTMKDEPKPKGKGKVKVKAKPEPESESEQELASVGDDGMEEGSSKSS
jgi:hypothetical protein